MNEAAARALCAAEAAGVKQIKFLLDDDAGGRCAGGVIIESLLGVRALMTTARNPTDWFQMFEDAGRAADMTPNEWSRMVQMNNREGLTFSEIARKLGPDSA